MGAQSNADRLAHHKFWHVTILWVAFTNLFDINYLEEIA
jgi:hypothetical protein